MRAGDADRCDGCGFPKHPRSRCHTCDLFALSTPMQWHVAVTDMAVSAAELLHRGHVEFARACDAAGMVPLPRYTEVRVVDRDDGRWLTLSGRGVPA